MLVFFLRVLTICKTPLAAGRFDCTTLYSSSTSSYRNDFMYAWIITQVYFNVYPWYHKRSIDPCSLQCSPSMGQQDEGTTGSTLEKVNLRGGLTVE